MTDRELAKRFKMGDSVSELAGKDGDDCGTIEIRLRAIMVGMDLALEQMWNEREPLG